MDVRPGYNHLGKAPMMKKLSVALFLWLAFSSPAWAENVVGPSAQVLCNRAANVAVGPTSATQIVAGVAGQSIFVCGWQITNTGATGTFTFIYGTGTTCTSPTTLVTVQSITS